MPVANMKILEKTYWQKKPCWQTKGKVNIALSGRYQHTNNQPIPVYEVGLFELAVIGTILWKTTLSERYQHQQPVHVKFVCFSSYKYYLICYEKQKDTGKLGKLYSRKKASMRKWKSENETENANTSYL